MWFSRCQSMLAIKATQKDQDDLTRIIRYFVLQFSHQSRLAIHKHTSFGCPQFWVGTNPLIYSLIFGCGAITVPQRQSCTTWRHGQFEATRGQPVCYKRPRGDAQAICSLFITVMTYTQNFPNKKPTSSQTITCLSPKWRGHPIPGTTATSSAPKLSAVHTATKRVKPGLRMIRIQPDVIFSLLRFDHLGIW